MTERDRDQSEFPATSLLSGCRDRREHGGASQRLSMISSPS